MGVTGSRKEAAATTDALREQQSYTRKDDRLGDQFLMWRYQGDAQSEEVPNLVSWGWVGGVRKHFPEENTFVLDLYSVRVLAPRPPV